jgi:hypothetical protein
MKSANYNFYLLGSARISIALNLLLTSQAVLAAHYVSVIKAEPVSKTVHLTLMADVSDPTTAQSSISQPERTYHLSVQLPNGVTPDLSVGSSVAVTLPTIHHNSAFASVKSISKTQVALVLANQVQILEGQRLRVILPLKPAHLFRIPFQAIYSPRGLTTEVFLLSNEKRTHLVPVVPLQALPEGKMIVSADQLDDATVVVQGTDNLISGDSVQVVDQKETSHL